MHYISPHGYREYSSESCSYRGDIILGSTTLKDVDFNGVPLCAFLHNAETYFLTLRPFFIYTEEGKLDRALFHPYIWVTDSYRYTESFISRYLEALTIFKCLDFEREWQNSVIFYDILRIYRELFEEIEIIKDVYSDSSIPSPKRLEARKFDMAKLQKDALSYISQTLRAKPGIMHLNMREHIRENESLCHDIEMYSFEATKEAILEIYNLDYLSHEEKQEYMHILDYMEED